MQAPSSQLLRALRSAVNKQPIRQHPTPSRSLTRHIQSRPLCQRRLSTSVRNSEPPRSSHTRSNAPATHDRGPPSKEDTQTDFGAMDILGNMAQPATSIDACTSDGFHLNNGIKTSGGSGVLLLGGEAFTWHPWRMMHTGASSWGYSSKEGLNSMLSKNGVLEMGSEGWGVLECLYPRPDLLIVGTGGRMQMLGKRTREVLAGLGIRVDVMDTGNAAAAYNLLATERGVDGVGAALLPVGWKGR